MNLKRFRNTPFASFSEKEIQRMVDVYYKEFVTKHLIDLDWDVLEVLELCTFRPKKLSLIRTIEKFFLLRRKHKEHQTITMVEESLKKYIRQYWMLRNGNQRRKECGIKKLL